MTRRFPVVAALAGVVIVTLLVGTALGWWSGGPSGHALARPLSVQTRLMPAAAYFGDPVTADVTVDLDSRVVDPGSVHVQPSFAPYVESAPPVVSSSAVGRDMSVDYRYTLQCVTDGCLPTTAPRTVQLPPVTVTARTAGRERTITAAWPTVTVASRLVKSDLQGSTPRFRHTAPLPSPVYSTSPTGLALALTIVAGVLGVGAAVLLGLELAALLRRRRVSAVAPTALESALALVRDAAARRDPADRRKALELLAEALVAEGNPTAADAAEQVAWAEAPPSSDRALEVADEAAGSGSRERS